MEVDTDVSLEGATAALSLSSPPILSSNDRLEAAMKESLHGITNNDKLHLYIKGLSADDTSAGAGQSINFHTIVKHETLESTLALHVLFNADNRKEFAKHNFLLTTVTDNRASDSAITTDLNIEHFVDVDEETVGIYLKEDVTARDIKPAFFLKTVDDANKPYKFRNFCLTNPQQIIIQKLLISQQMSKKESELFYSKLFSTFDINDYKLSIGLSVNGEVMFSWDTTVLYMHSCIWKRESTTNNYIIILDVMEKDGGTQKISLTLQKGTLKLITIIIY
eukprot:GHVS01015054.1.p1 GENE.GHVS01015054.1~~GHVS01015054.1.p1  ORF type:complete len:306 (+),score=19.84 GHVS01015054.1:85-918(+)